MSVGTEPTCRTSRLAWKAPYTLRDGAHCLDLDLNHVTLLSMPPQHLYNLVHVDLSYNKLSSLEGVHTKLGNIKTLNLAGNLLRHLSGLHKLYSLVNLDLSDNRIEQVSRAPEGIRVSGEAVPRRWSLQ